MSGEISQPDDQAKARALCEALMRRAVAIDRHNRDFLKSLREYSAEIERQTLAMTTVLRREIEQNPET